MTKTRRILISEDSLEILTEGKIKNVEKRKIKLGRWILKEKIGEFIGYKSKIKS